MKILDPETPHALAAIKGDRWWSAQEQDRTSPYGFFAWLAAARQADQSGGEAAGIAPSDLVSGGDGMIYGEGGWRRYTVHRDGELVLLSWSATPEGRAKASLYGIRIT